MSDDPRVADLLGLLGGVGEETTLGVRSEDASDREAPSNKSVKRAKKAPKAPKASKPPKPPNPCLGASIEQKLRPAPAWRVELPFVLSTKALSAYADHHRHQKVLDRRQHPPKVTFDDMAIGRLVAKYPKDPLYPLILDFRTIQKLLGTYVEAPLRFVKPNGRICGELMPSTLTLRMAQKAPSLLNVPRPSGGLQSIPRSLYVAAPGHTLCALDFSAIEAVFVGYEAQDPGLIRAAKLGVHDFFMAAQVGQPADLSWDDQTLGKFLKATKAREPKPLRDACKQTVHLSHYLGTPRKMHLLHKALFPTEGHARESQEAYLGLFPRIRQWQQRVCAQCDSQGFVAAPSGFRLHYCETFKWTFDAVKKEWEKDYGVQAAEAVAAVPQHLGAVHLIDSLCTVCERWPEFLTYVRLPIHDELLWECPDGEVDLWIERGKSVMEAPRSWLPLPASWGMGSHLSIGTEHKVGKRWSEMA